MAWVRDGPAIFSRAANEDAVRKREVSRKRAALSAAGLVLTAGGAAAGVLLLKRQN